MSIQAYDADMVERPGIEALAAAGVGNLWRTMGGVWPLWSALTLVYAVVAAAVEVTAPPVAGGLQFGLLAIPAIESLAAGLVTGVATRIFLSREGAWKPDLGLAAYAGIVTFVGAGPAALASMAQTPTLAEAPGALQSYMAFAAAGLVLGLVILWTGLRLTLWPIGKLVGDADMTPGRSWKLMQGAVLRYVLAVVLLGAPLFILELIVAMLTKPEGRLISQIAVAPLTSLMALLAAAVAAEIYRTRVCMAYVPPPVEDDEAVDN
jgi:hypothetical protein